MEIKTKNFKCWKDIGGKGEMISCEYKNKASAVHLHPDSIILEGLKYNLRIN